MALEFTITTPPPALADIEAELEQATIDRALLRKKNIRFLVTILLIVAAYATFMLKVTIPLLADPTVVPDFVATVAYFTPYLTFLIFIFGNAGHNKMIERPRKILDTRLAALQVATPGSEAAIRDCGQRYREVADYQQRVTALGRPMMAGESEMLLQWVELRMQEECGLRKVNIQEATI